MWKSKKISLNVADRIARVISSRDIIQSLDRVIASERSRVIELDFSDVDFVSRSAAHEFLLLRDRMSWPFLRRKKIIFTNLNNEVKMMLRAAEANSTTPPKKDGGYKPQRISIDSLPAEA